MPLLRVKVSPPKPDVVLDVPDPENRTFTTYLHWLQSAFFISTITHQLTKFYRPNIPLSCATRAVEVSEAHTPYIPPHPQRGTSYHRYVLLLLPQQSPTEPISVPALSDADRLRFDVREFATKHGLDGSTGGGAHMWRQAWDEGVSQIYAAVLGMFPLSSRRPRIYRLPLQDGRNPGLQYHLSKTAMPIFVASGDTPSSLSNRVTVIARTSSLLVRPIHLL
jgi:large subunit ribosomal protein L35